METGAPSDADQRQPASDPLAALATIAGGLVSQVTRDMLAYWGSLCERNGCRVPARSQLDPGEIPPRLLPHLFLCEFTPDGGVLIRLQGGYLSESAGQALTWRRIDRQTFGDNAAAVLQVYAAVRDTGRPIATHQRVLTTLGVPIVSEVLHLPFCRGDRPDGPVGFVLGALDRIDNAVAGGRDARAAEWTSIEVLRSV
ncbi:MAG: PAS domain-containing protein [Alphaproteobacteria bacterium]